MYEIAWGAITAAFVITEGVAIARHDWDGTFTENVRKLFMTHKKLGRIAFMAVWSAFSIWFFGHILKLWP